MRILELINTLEEGGAEKITSALALQLRSRGHDVFVICVRDEGFMPVPKERFESAGVPVTAFHKPDGFHWKTLRRLGRYLTEQRIDVIHTHNPLVNHYGVAAAKMAAHPSVVVNTVHGVNTLEMPASGRALYRMSCEGTARVVPVCDAVDRVIGDRFHIPSDRRTVIPNGIDLAHLAEVPLRPRNGSFVFGTMARLVPVKDHVSLLRAFAEVRARIPNCALEILGGGEMEPELKSLAHTLGIDAAVQFRGWSGDIAGFLKGLDAFVLSSRSEGLPLALLEAMAASKPIVSTAVGGVPEIVKSAGCGWLCPPQDSAALANSMFQLMTCSNLEEFGRRGRAAAIRLYSESTMTDRYEKLFLALVGGTA